MSDSTKNRALEAIDAAIAANRAIRAKLEEAIAERLWKRRSVDKERADKASVISRLARLRRRRLEIEAAAVVVSAPTVAEIKEVRRLVKEINDLALADATRTGLLTFLKSAGARAAKLREGVKT